MLTLLTNLPKDQLMQQLQDGLILLVLGMGTVFIFLVILIFATKLMSKICSKLSKPEAVTNKNAAPSRSAAPAAVAKNDSAIAAAIAAAYDKNR